MEHNSSDFIDRLSGGPAILFLGQQYLQLESGSDPLLVETLQKFGGSGNAMDLYRQILKSKRSEHTEEVLTWMHWVCQRLPAPNWLKTVARFQWNSVFSSAFDSHWMRVFEDNWRVPHPIYGDNRLPLDPRSPSRLHCWFLFGSVIGTKQEFRVPLTPGDLRARSLVASVMLKRLPDILTPMGVLAIEGYGGQNDFLRLDDMLGIVDGLNPGQVHWFSVSPWLESHEAIQDLAQQGKIVLHRESLAACLRLGEESGRLRLGLPAEEARSGHRITLRIALGPETNRTIVVPRELWARVSRSAIVLDDSDTVRPPSVSDDRLYEEFRRFLAESSTRPIWSSYGRGLSFRRAYERELYEHVGRHLAAKDVKDEPIILHGQTGTGKTVALGALAYRVRQEGLCPVLFIERRPERPKIDDIRAFCQWATNSGAPVCLIVWDGMLEPREYSDFLQNLTSRPYRVVLIGSSYRETEPNRQGKRREYFVEAPAALTVDEQQQFEHFLSKFEPSLGRELRDLITRGDEAFLVALYRLLPPTRRQLRQGLVAEANRAVQTLLDQDRTKESPTAGQVGTMAALLWATLKNAQPDLLPDRIAPVEIEGRPAPDAQLLLGLIMVPGKFGLRVPIELLLRVVGTSGYRQLPEELQALDIIRWDQDSNGNITLGPRHRLEADEIVQSWFRTAQTQLDIIRQLVLNVRDGAWDDNRELQFASELVKHVGPQGHSKAFYADSFMQLAETLRELREVRWLENESMLLAEANALREGLIHYNNTHLAQHPQTEAFLERVESIINRGLELLDERDKRNSSGLRTLFLVELASTMGARARTVKRSEALSWLRRSKEVADEARRLDPGSSYPYDVVLWIARDLLLRDVFSSNERAEVEADVWDTISKAELEISGDYQTQRLQKRIQDLAQVLGRREIAEEAFERLKGMGSCAGFYLRALYMAQPLTGENGTFSDSDRKRFQQAVTFLEENYEFIRRDGRCLYLLFRSKWQAESGKELFAEERQTVAFSEMQWRGFLSLMDDLEQCGEVGRSPWLTYLKGIILFHLARYNQATEVFDELKRRDKVRGPRRYRRSYLMSDAMGNPRVFDGTVDWVDTIRDRGEVNVEGLFLKIPFEPQRNFLRTDIHAGERLGEFYVAFNLVGGPIADPPAYLRKRG